MSGQIPDPPATRSSGPPSAGAHTKYPPIGPAKFQLVTGMQLTGEIRRDLAVVEPLDGERDALIGGRSRRDRVAALRLVSVVSGQAHIHMLACLMSRPFRNSEHAGFAHVGSHRRGRRPRRCARSVAAVALFLPRVAIHVIAVRLPEARRVLVHQPQPAHPLGAFPEVQMRHEQPRRATVLALERLPVECERDPRLAAGEVVEREVGGVPTVAETPSRSRPPSRRLRAACRPRRPPTWCRTWTTW